MKCKLLTGIIMTFLTVIPTVSFALAAGNQKPKTEPNSVIVMYKNRREPIVASLKGGESMTAALRRYAADPTVVYAEPNYTYHASITPNDREVGNQWYLKRIKAPEGWDIHSTSPGVIIAVIDSGVQIDHPDLKANIWANPGEIEGNKKDDDGNGFVDDKYGWDFVNNVPDPSPKFKGAYTEAGILHGTIVAGLAAASGNNNEGISGVTWNARIMALKALDDRGDGDTATVIRAIDYAVAKGANIINLSFVGFNYSRSLKDALQRAYNAGVIVVAPAGNEQSDAHGVNLNEKPIYPACYRDENNQSLVVGVAATDGIDQKAPFSGYGDRCIDIAAPGVGFYSTSVYAPEKSFEGRFFTKYYDGYWSGTSVAVPLVTGALALIQGANPTLSAREALTILLSTSDDINALNPDYKNQLGRGRLNVALALSEATSRLKRRMPFLAFAPVRNAEPVVTIADTNGEALNRFTAYKDSFRGGVNLAAGDLDGDGNDEIVTAPASGMEADIRIFDRNGKFKTHFLAYPQSFRGGVNVAVGDVTGDGKAEIITAPAWGLRSDIKIYNGQGKLIRSFLAYPASFTGGASVAVGDVTGNGLPEIVTGAGKGGIPQVKIFSSAGKLISDFITDPSRKPTGLRISLLDIDGNSRRRQSEILVTRQSGTPLVSIFDLRGGKRREWQAYVAPFVGDVKATTADLDGDGFKEIIVTPGIGGGPHVRIFNRLGAFRRSFYAYESGADIGVNLTAFFIKR